MVAAEKAYEAVELAKATGKIRKGTNEVTKALEKGEAKLVVYAKDVTPKEIVMHLPLLSKEHKVLCVEVPSKEELGTAAGIARPASAIVIVELGEARKVVESMGADDER